MELVRSNKYIKIDVAQAAGSATPPCEQLFSFRLPTGSKPARSRTHVKLDQVSDHPPAAIRGAYIRHRVDSKYYGVGVGGEDRVTVQFTQRPRLPGENAAGL